MRRERLYDEVCSRKVALGCVRLINVHRMHCKVTILWYFSLNGRHSADILSRRERQAGHRAKYSTGNATFIDGNETEFSDIWTVFI